MALVFTENWKSYGATSDIIKKWAALQSPWTWNATGGPDGGPCVSCATTGGMGISSQVILPSGTNRFSFGVWVKFTGGWVANNTFFRFLNNVAGVSMQLRHINDTSGRWIMGDLNGTAMAVAVRSITDGLWHWLEGDVNISNNGPCKLSTDGVLESAAALWSGVGNAYTLQLVSMTGLTTYFGPMIVWDNVGSALNASHYPLGPRDIATIRPDGDGTVQFSRSGGSTNFSLVDETGGESGLSRIVSLTRDHTVTYTQP